MSRLTTRAKTVCGIFHLMKRPESYLYDYFFNPVEKEYELRDDMKIRLGTRSS